MTDSYCICVKVEDDFGDKVPTCQMREAIAAVLSKYAVEPGTGVTLLITDDESIHKLNLRFLGVDAPTDVLSFPAGDDLPGVEENPYLGDIVIAYPYAAAQADNDGYDRCQVLTLLAVHGTLHLLGFDHDNAENQAVMWAAQETMLAQLGIPTHIIPPPHTY